MSNHLYWLPPRGPSGNRLPYVLKSVLAPRLWGQDGSVRSDKTRLDEGNLDYLYGLADAGVEGALELINAIQRHGAVDVWIAG